MSEWETHWLGDLDYFVRCRADMSPAFLKFEPKCIGMEFEAFEGIGWPGNQAPEGWPKDVAYSVWKRGYHGDGDDIGVESLAECHRAVHGQIRWGGEGHIYFGEPGDEGYLYCGGIDEAVRIGRLMEHLWKIAYDFYVHECVSAEAEDFVIER